MIWDLIDTKRLIINNAQDMGCTVSGLLVASGTLRCSVVRIRTWANLILWRLAYRMSQGGYSCDARERLPLSAGDKLLVEKVARHARPSEGHPVKLIRVPLVSPRPTCPSAPCWHPNSGGERPEGPKRSSLIGGSGAPAPLKKSQ